MGEADPRLARSLAREALKVHPEIVADYTALADAAALVGSPATRQVGTLGGNVIGKDRNKLLNAGETVQLHFGEVLCEPRQACTAAT